MVVVVVTFQVFVPVYDVYNCVVCAPWQPIELNGLCTVRLHLVETLEKQGDRKCVSPCAFSNEDEKKKKKKGKLFMPLLVKVERWKSWGVMV